MTLNEAEGHFCCLNLCNSHNSGNTAHFNYVSRELNFIVKGEGLLKVTGSHIHWKSGNISEMVLNKDVVTTGH